MEHGVSEFHFYTLNRAALTQAVCENIGITSGQQKVEAAS
jgi:5,10-methylenetetrahydrofolate reductase